MPNPLLDSSSAQKRSHSLASGSSSTNSGLVRRSDTIVKSPLKQSSRLTTKSSSGASASMLRGLSAASLKQQNRTAKLLDINEQPIGGSIRETKRRKKMLAEADVSEEEKKNKELSKCQEQTTPEYAIGLTAPTPVSHAATATVPSTTATPSYASMAGLTRFTNPTTTAKSDVTPIGAPLSSSLANFSQELQMHIERESENMTRRAIGGQMTGNSSTSFKPSVSLQHAPSSAPAPRNIVPISTNVPSAPKRDLKLTREQMLAAQEMFRGANKVTKPEKALILGFMAGARENPLPDKGPVITIKLSEHTEVTNDTSQTQLVEMLFEMNYDTGHWRRLKRTRVIARQQTTEQGS